MKSSILAIALAALAVQAHAAPPKPDAKLMAAVRACDKDGRAILEKIVAIDSGSADREGVNAVGQVMAGEFKALGATVKAVPSAPGGTWGDNVVASLTGTGKGRLLLIAHMDTVFSKGDVAKHKPRWEGDHYFGPGAGDDKSGVVTAWCALKALTATGYKDFARLDVLLNASEEIGSPGSKDLIMAMAKDSDVAINLERGLPKEKMVIARKGSGTLVLEIMGRAAHAGVEPEKGRNAVLEASRVALALGALADPVKETSVTVTMITGGTKNNVVPDHAVLVADVRAFSQAEFDRVRAGAVQIATRPGIEGVTMTSNLSQSFPPWARLPAGEAMLARANRLYAELGRTLTPASSGGAADSSLAASTGTPTLDGFGMEGDGAHSLDDQAHLETLVPRAYLLARMIEDVGHSPK